MVSKAALMSNRTKMLQAPVSAEARRSFVTRTSPVSVCPNLNPDWNGSNKLFLDRYYCSWPTTTTSRTLARKNRFAIGLQLDKSSALQPDFLRTGLIVAVLRARGTWPVAKELLIIEVMDGQMCGKHFFRTSVGKGSRKRG